MDLHAIQFLRVPISYAQIYIQFSCLHDDSKIAVRGRSTEDTTDEREELCQSVGSLP